MSFINKNTVSAENQTINSSDLYFLGDKDAETRILIVGNSITRHGPNKELGWERDCGMAASAPEKDYVHRLYSMLKKNGKNVFMRIRQCSYWETHFTENNVLERYEEDRNFNADYVIFRLGDNSVNVPNDLPEFKCALKEFIAKINNGGQVIFTSCFWHLDSVDEKIREVAAELGCPYIELGDLGDDSTMRATGLYEHSGVAWHPSDKGMDNIAQRIFNTLLKCIR